MTDHSATQVISGRSARNAATWLNIGNIVAMVIFPLLILWTGASMLVYALNRHHPNPKVGHYTQVAAYRFYAVVGFFVAVGIFIPLGAWIFYMVAWLIGLVIVVPASIRDLKRIYQDKWDDVEISVEPTQDHHH